MTLNNRAIVVLGMHRSGTSAFTGLLSLLGVDLGPTLLAASSANEAGYWEHGPVVTVHERLLLALDSRWDDVGRLPDRWWESPRVAPYRDELRNILLRDFGASKLWAIKDPRTCRLLPLWIPLLEELGCRPLWVNVVRHPAENIRSLEKRNSFSHEKSELLWLHHALEAESATRGRDRIHITFDQLMNDCDGTLRRIEQALGMPWPVPPAQAEMQIRQFVDPAKRHHRAADDTGLSWWTRDTYQALSGGAAGNEAAMPPLLDPVNRALDAAVSLFSPMIRNRGSEVEMQMADVSKNYANLFDAFRDLQERYRETKEKLTAKSAELKSRKEDLRRFERSTGGRLARFLSRFRRKHDAPEVEASSFPKPVDPIEVSIIVSASTDTDKTVACLNAIREQTTGLSYEVLMVSGDTTARALRPWENLKSYPVGKARSFGEAHNRAAQHSRGRYLIFLQDDMIVVPGWVDALIEPFRSRPDTGLVGAEAGSVNAEGKFDLIPDAAQPSEVDYCTTACLAITRNLFFQIGGFDGFYRPVEEVSFSLKIGQTRRKVIQQPLCRPTRQGSRRQLDATRLESNHRRFMRRWAETLAARTP